MEVDQLTALRSPAGSAALAAASRLAGTDPLRAAAALRAGGLPADLAAAALTQATLRLRAAVKFGPDAGRMFFTRTGLEQATRAVVANRRAARLAASGARVVADLGCGIGADAIAFARAGLRVLAVEADRPTAAVAAANVAALGLAGQVTVCVMDATTVALDPVDAVFCDPARRAGPATATGASRRVLDPRRYRPPWEFVSGLASRVPRTVLKLAPGIDHDLIPPGAEAEWVSVAGDLVEATVWSGPLAEVARRATLLRPGTRELSLTGTGARSARTGALGRYLYDPDAAVVRSHLVAEFAETIDGRLADPTIAYVYSDTAHHTPFASSLRVDEALPFSVKRLRAALRVRGVGELTIAKRGSAVDVDALRRALRPSGPRPATVVLTRVAGAPYALICTRLLGA